MMHVRSKRVRNRALSRTRSRSPDTRLSAEDKIDRAAVGFKFPDAEQCFWLLGILRILLLATKWASFSGPVAWNNDTQSSDGTHTGIIRD
jgi:hypothetical protein